MCFGIIPDLRVVDQRRHEIEWMGRCTGEGPFFVAQMSLSPILYGAKRGGGEDEVAEAEGGN